MSEQYRSKGRHIGWMRPDGSQVEEPDELYRNFHGRIARDHLGYGEDGVTSMDDAHDWAHLDGHVRYTRGDWLNLSFHHDRPEAHENAIQLIKKYGSVAHKGINIDVVGHPSDEGSYDSFMEADRSDDAIDFIKSLRQPPRRTTDIARARKFKYGESVEQLRARYYERADHLISLVLNEDRTEALQQKWADKLNVSHERPSILTPDKMRARVVSHVIGHVDPTPNKQYSDRLLQWYHQGQFRMEDSQRVRDAVQQFHGTKHRLTSEHAGPEVKNPKDINSYPSIHHLEGALGLKKPEADLSWTKTTSKQRDAVEQGSEVIHDDPELTVRKVKTHDAMKVLGSNTHWCVVADKEYFDGYNDDAPMYHFHEKKTGARKLMHAPSDQFKDENDEEHPRDEFEKKHPVVRQLFKGHSYDMFNDPKEHDARYLAGHPVEDHILDSMASRSANQQVLHKIANTRVANANRDLLWSVLDNKNTSGATLGQIYKERFKARELPVGRFVRHPNTPANVLHSIVKKSERGVDAGLFSLGNFTTTKAISAHRNTSPKTLSYIGHKSIEDTNPDSWAYRRRETIKSVLSNPNTPEDFLKHALSRGGQIDSYEPVTPHIARNPKASPEVLDDLWKHANSASRSSKGRVYDLAFDYLAQHPNTPEHIQLKLAHLDPYSMSANHTTGPKVVGTVLDALSRGTQHSAAPTHANHPGAPTTQMATITNLASHPNLSPEHHAEVHRRGNELLDQHRGGWIGTSDFRALSKAMGRAWTGRSLG